MPTRRDFLAGSALGVAALASGGWARLEFDSTWLTYAPDIERFWGKLPFLDRLAKVADAGFSHYEFTRWKTRDYSAIMKRNEELNLAATIFSGAPALKGSKWREPLVELLEEAAMLAPKLGSSKLAVIGPERDEKLDRPDQVDEFVEALKEALEKLTEAESEVVLILEPTRAAPNRPPLLIGTLEEAASVVKAVGSDKVKCACAIDPKAAIDEVVGQIDRFQGQIGHYRLADFAPPDAANEARIARVLKAIQATGHADPIGLGLAEKVDPALAIESIRKLDAAAKVL
jgi:hydroxypyruvate isomerase